ncbi:OPT oligopeptide transporter protein-domain-containing protein [Multifurca ochricompacta]|uniref:OPT oligopeptide transporter protein-domain-containing protein n=1 Tax=Multifurca ochricompacta TaxID=376703 RepID=A0AAD4QS67_9AGAM|nr:OPT oligopeptide transporter protein-domain-containing protein [Multifurca ochricompacta]
MTELEETLPTLLSLSGDPAFDEKAAYTGTRTNEKEAALESDKSSDGFDDEDEKPLYVNGEPVITSGRDVSKYLVDLRDDGDPPFTLRSIFLGTVIGGLGAALYQIYVFKPVQAGISTVFLLLVIYTFGVLWSAFLPKRTWVQGTRYEWLAPTLHFINPGEFKIKEHVISSIVASSASYGSTSVLNFAVQRLYYDMKVRATTAVLATFSTAVFGYGIVGLLRPLTVYPSEMVYWTNLPTVSIFQALHFDTSANHKRVRLFWTAFAAMFIYEVIPSYIFPLLNGFSIFCLASQHASPNVQDIFTNIFGGADGNEGLGLFSLSFDWQYIGSTYMSLPLIQQANSWIGYFFCYIAIAAIYYSNTWNAKYSSFQSKSFPMLSTSLFSSNGSIYHQAAVFTGQNFQLNQTALEEVGLPALTGSNAWAGLMGSLAIGGLLAHCIFFWGPYVVSSFKHARDKTQPDPHWASMQRYEEAPWWWYMLLLLLAFFAGLISVLKGETTLPVWSYVVALLSGAIVTPFSTLLYARMGNGIATNQLFKMIAGAINPGRPVANLYFSMWSHDVVSTSIGLASDLKMGQYLKKIPPRAMFLTQVWGTIIGAIVNYVVMVSITGAQRDLLLNPTGNNIWSGQTVQSLNSHAITWSLAKQLYGPSGPYFIVPMGIFVGFAATFVHWLVNKRWPYIGGVRIDKVMLPIIYQYSAWMSVGVNSVTGTSVLVGLVSQFWLRRYHPGWYRKYNYILGGALDGGAQVMILILSFAVFGASGVSRPFPTWAGNPTKGNVDYCNGNGALS